MEGVSGFNDESWRCDAEGSSVFRGHCVEFSQAFETQEVAPSDSEGQVNESKRLSVTWGCGLGRCGGKDFVHFKR